MPPPGTPRERLFIGIRALLGTRVTPSLISLNAGAPDSIRRRNIRPAAESALGWPMKNVRKRSLNLLGDDPPAPTPEDILQEATDLLSQQEPPDPPEAPPAWGGYLPPDRIDPAD